MFSEFAFRYSCLLLALCIAMSVPEMALKLFEVDNSLIYKDIGNYQTSLSALCIIRI